MNERAEIERLLDDLVRTRAKLASANEELAKANECDRSHMAWDPASETYCSAADVMKELIQLREMYVYTASQAAKLRAELTTARAAQNDSTADETRPSDMPPMYGPPEWLARKGPVCNCNHPMWWHELGKGKCPRSVDDRPIRQPYDASSELNTQGGAS